MRVLILGGYGFIGAEIARTLTREGFSVVGLGRSAGAGRRLLPDIEWIGADMARLDAAEKWTPHISGAAAIVNAAGALQDGPRDNLAAVHQRSIAALVAAAANAGVSRFIQISAVGATPEASTAFLATKAAGDAAVRASALDWVIFKPGLVIGRNAVGGTALLRMAAGFPVAAPLLASSALIQTVSIEDVTAAVAAALRGEVPMRRDYDLVEDDPHSLRTIVRVFRRQLGFRPAVVEPDLPPWAGAAIGRLADAFGWLGWRSPLRTTAIKALSENVVGNPEPWRAVAGRSLQALEETLSGLPASAQERIFARAQIALPLMVATLAAFWIASGVVGVFARAAAAQHLVEFAGEAGATRLVIAGSIVDIAIGAGLLMRPIAKAAALASVAVSVVYLGAASLTEPQLWIDPFGVLIKVFPAMALGLSVALLLEER